MRTHSLILLLVGFAASAQAAPPPDLANLPQYEQSLQQSADPQAAVFLQEIADGPAALQKAEQAARVGGVTLDFSVIQRPLPAPQGNGAAAYQQLKLSLDQQPLALPQYAEPLSYGYFYTVPELAAVQQIVANRRAIFLQIHRLAQMTIWEFPHDWSQEMPMAPQANNLRAEARALDTESYLIAQKGDVEAAVRNQALGMTLGKHVASTPLLLNFLAGVGIDNITLSGFKSLLYLSGPNASVASGVENQISANAFPLSLKDALAGDMNLKLSRIAQFPATVAATQTLNASQTAFAANLTAAAEARRITMTLPLLKAASLADPQRRTLAASLMETLRQQEMPNDPVDALNASVAVSSDDSLNAVPSITFLIQLEDRVHAQERVTLAAAAALAIKAETGTFPETLPVHLTDPYSGQPLLYRKQGDSGFIVYSVGPRGSFNSKILPQFQLTPENAFFQYPAPLPQPVTPDMMSADL